MDLPALASIPDTQDTPAVAFNGTVYLVVWRDARVKALTGADIWATRLSATGTVLDPAGIPVSTGVGTQTNPAVATDGTDFFVVWTDARDAATKGTDIYGTKVSAAGIVASPGGAPVESTGVDEASATVSYDTQSSQWLVVFEATQPVTGSDVLARRLAANGAPVGNSFAVKGGLGSQRLPSSAYAGSGVTLVAWVDDRDGGANVWAGRVTSTGASSDFVVGDPAGSATDVSVHAGVGDALVLWSESSSAGYFVYASRVTAAGSVVDAPARVVENTPTTGPSLANPSAALDGLSWRIGYQSQGAGLGGTSSVRTAAMDPSSGALTLAPTVFDTMSSGAAVAASSTVGQTFVTYARARSGDTDVVGGFWTSAAALTAPASLVASSVNAERAPAIAWDGTRHVLVWADDRAPATSPDDLYRQTVTAAGIATTPAPLLSSNARREFSPFVAGADGGYLVTWFTDDTVNPVRRNGLLQAFAADGSALGANAIGLGGIPATAGVEPMRAVWNGRWFQIPYMATAGTAGMNELRVALVTRNGALFDGGVPFTQMEAAPAPAMDISTLGAQSVVFYEAAANDGGLLAQLVSSSGEPVLTSRRIAADAFSPSSATDGTRVLVVFTSAGAATSPDVLGLLFEADGGISAPIGIATTAASESGAVAAYDGKRYVVAYEEASALDAGAPGAAKRIAVRWVELNGAPLRAGPEIIFDGGLATRSLSISAAPTNQRTQVVFSETDAATASLRLRRIAVEFDLDGGAACTEALDCKSGFCVDGVCCESACGGGDVSDCVGCSVAAGSSSDGTCDVLPVTHVCRGVASGPSCDVPETCDGISTSCPADSLKPALAECREAAGPCDISEVCDGTTRTCPPDALKDSTFVCRPSSQGMGCDAPEACSGTSAACPDDTISAQGAVCVPETACTEAASCGGASAECPAVSNRPDGTPCEGKEGFECRSGVCTQVKFPSHYALVPCGCGSSEGGSLLGGALAVLAVLWLRRRDAARLLRRRGWGAFVGAAVLVFGSAESSAQPAKLRVTMTGVAAMQGVTAEQAETLTSLVQSHLVSHNVYAVIGPQDVRTILGVERQKQLLGCSDESNDCMAELAGALDAQRILSGTVAVVDDASVLNLTLIDARSSSILSRVARRAEGSNPVNALDGLLGGAVAELISADPANAGRRIVPARGFGGVVAGVRGDGDVAGGGLAPGVTAEFSGKRLGGALTFLYGRGPAIRAEARFYPVQIGSVRAYLGVGATTFPPDVAARASAGLALQLGFGLQLFADAAFERFLNPASGSVRYADSAVLIGAGAGWAF